MSPGPRPAASFLEVDPGSDFPLQNLPFGVFRRPGDPAPRIGTRIGDHVLDLRLLEKRGLFRGQELQGSGLFQPPTLNAFMAAGRPAWREARAALTRLLTAGESELEDDAPLRALAILSAAQVKMCLPADIGDYTDFYSSREHATNVGTMFRGADNALMPNWLHLPIAYHGRASSIVVSDTDVVRPRGQSRPDDAAPPRFGPSRMLDFELELGFFVGPGNPLGRAIPAAEASEHIFGLVLVNDWSARDIQKWEYQPLGPFLAKNFATSISPWVVMLEALEPFRCEGPEQDPAPLPYLGRAGANTYDIRLEVTLEPPGGPEQRVTLTNFRHLYWSMNQQLAHHTVGGCNVRPGDLMASGTISGPTRESRGSLLELAWGGKEPLPLAGGVTRASLQDGDRVTMRGWCEGEGYRLGFGEVAGTILPAPAVETQKGS